MIEGKTERLYDLPLGERLEKALSIAENYNKKKRSERAFFLSAAQSTAKAGKTLLEESSQSLEMQR